MLVKFKVNTNVGYAVGLSLSNLKIMIKKKDILNGSLDPNSKYLDNTRGQN